MGGRISLIKSVLSSLSIFQILFFKTPIGVYKEIEKIQNVFLWGSNAIKREIIWVGCELLCMSKENGGLGFKSFNEFNVALLFKWIWRILQGSNSLWVKVLTTRYVSLKHILLSTGTRRNPKSSSAWWSYILQIVSNMSFMLDFSYSDFMCKLRFVMHQTYWIIIN